MEHRFVRVNHGVEADLNSAVEAAAKDGWELEDAFPAAGDVVLLFSRTKPAEPAAEAQA